MSCSGGVVRIRLLALKLLPVVTNEVQLLSVSGAGVEVIILHFSVRLLIVPVIVIEAINGAHYTGAMTATGTMQIEFFGVGIIHDLQKQVRLLHRWIGLVNNRNIHVSHSRGFNRRLFALS